MAIGDTRNAILTIPASSVAKIIPTDGETWLMTNITVSNDNSNNGICWLENFANGGDIYLAGATTANGGMTFWNNVVCFNTLTNYYGVRNLGNNTSYAKFNGIVANDGTKGVVPVGTINYIVANGNMDIRPPSGVEWQIDAIFSNGEMYATWNPEGIVFEYAVPANDWACNLKLNVTNTNYITIHNMDSRNSHLMGYVGHIK